MVCHSVRALSCLQAVVSVCVCLNVYVCFHSTSVRVDHVSKRFTGGLQSSRSTERWRKGRQGSSTSEALTALNWAIPASERTLQRPPYHTTHSTIWLFFLLSLCRSLSILSPTLISQFPLLSFLFSLSFFPHLSFIPSATPFFFSLSSLDLLPKMS